MAQPVRCKEQTNEFPSPIFCHVEEALVLPFSAVSFAMPIAPAAKNALISITKITVMITAAMIMPML